MKRRKYLVVFILLATTVASIFLLSFLMPQEDTETEFADSIRIEVATDAFVSSQGSMIRIEAYTASQENNIHLIVSGTYGSIVLTPETLNGDAVFRIPPSFTKRAGVVNYHLLHDQKTIEKGTFKILPDTRQLGRVETYLGPRSVIANERDYTMLVSIPTDWLDNMLPDSTKISLKEQFKNTISETQHDLSSGIAWKRIPAPLQTGRISTGSAMGNHSSTELVADVFPDLAQDFSITTSTNHGYADGNEIITIKTSQIKDSQGNTITDGTLVTFSIQDDLCTYWQVQATTVNGFAFAKALHPQIPTSWRINASIIGIAQSEEILQSFEPILETIPVTITADRMIVVGPLTSYLGQLVPEGIDVSLTIGDKVFKEHTKNGKVTFAIKEGIYPKGDYLLKIETLGLEHKRLIKLD